MIDRTVAPPSYKIKKPNFLIPNLVKVSTNIDLYSLSLGTQNVVQFEIVLESGSISESKPGLSYLAANMLMEGTKNRNFKELADIIDFYGASIDIKSGLDYLVISLSCLVAVLPNMLDILEEVLLYPAFDSERLEHIQSLKIQDILMDNSKTDKVAKKTLRSSIFSNDFPYGHILTEEDINNVTIVDVKNFYREKFFNDPKFFISGLFSEKALDRVQLWIKNLSGNLSFIENDKKQIVVPIEKPQSLSVTIKDSPVQASICLGKLMPSKSSPDFIDIYLVNTLIGGYFGSRLMKNIREVNGYTYGIYSSILSMKQGSFLMIAADVAVSYLDATLAEISNEIIRLYSEEVPKQELKVLKNYLMGNLKNGMDNPLVLMERFKSIKLYDMNENYYENLYESIYNLDEDRIQEITKQYFTIEEMSKVVVK